MTKTPLLYITHIFDAIKSIQTQMKGLTKGQFEDSELIQDLPVVIEKKTSIFKT